MSQETLSSNVLAAYSCLLTLKEAAISCQNICTQSFLARLNQELGMSDLPSHSDLFKIIVPLS